MFWALISFLISSIVAWHSHLANKELAFYFLGMAVLCGIESVYAKLKDVLKELKK